ncbi:hypothetical protein B0H13DRAFT_139773 [Mycena leptocephala]|nr:hypothetical protein B0H13DRAFT_139773 [Mycena leptocephala]
MLLLLTVLTAVGSAVSLTVSDPGNILQSGGRTTIQWVTNSNTDPGDFNIELLSPTYNLVAVLAQHVGTVLYQYTIDLPPVPPSPAQQVWAKSRSFSIASNTTTAAPLLAPSTQTQPKGTTSAGHSETSISTERFSTSGSFAGQTSTTPGSATQMSQSSTSSSISKSINSPPTSFMSATSLMSAPSTSPPSSHSATQASTSRKSSAGASMAGIAVGIVSLLLMGASSGSVFAALAKTATPNGPQAACIYSEATR